MYRLNLKSLKYHYLKSLMYLMNLSYLKYLMNLSYLKYHYLKSLMYLMNLSYLMYLSPHHHHLHKSQ
jgi:hypothetical protein